MRKYYVYFSQILRVRRGMTNGIHNSGPWECSQHPGGHRMVLSPNHEGLLLPQQKILATLSINFCKTKSFNTVLETKYYE